MQPHQLLLALVGTVPAACGPAAIAAVVGQSGGGDGIGAPSRPTNLMAEPVGPDAVSLTWTDNADNETGHVIERRQAGDREFEAVVQLARDVRSHVLDGLAARTAYELRVVALNSGGLSASDIVAATTPAAIAIARLQPDSAAIDTQTPVLIRGSGFSARRPGSALSVRFGGATTTEVQVLDDTTMAMVPPPWAAGDTDVVLDNGYQTVVQPMAFTYFDPVPRFSPNDVRVNFSPVGATASGDPELACSGRLVFCAWNEIRNGVLDIYFSRSIDGGATFGPQLRVDTDNAGPGNSIDVEMAADQANVHVTWQDNRSGHFEIFYNRSTDQGATWGVPDTPIGLGLPRDSIDPEICASGDSVYVVWRAERSPQGAGDVYFNCSHDGGATWRGPVLINDDQAAGTDTGDPEIRCVGDAVYVAWVDSRSGHADIYFDRSLDRGVTWLPADVRLDGGGPGAPSFNVEFCVEGERLVAVWIDGRNGPLCANVGETAVRVLFAVEGVG